MSGWGLDPAGPYGPMDLILKLEEALEVYEAWRVTWSVFWGKDFSGCSRKNRLEEANSGFWGKGTRQLAAIGVFQFSVGWYLVERVQMVKREKH